MGELSFLTIIVSLAVCSLLVYAVFQYMKVRLTILEQSHKEQAMILQQFIEESSTDIHRLYQISSSSSNGGAIPTNGSIILEYANEKPAAYNEPHTIHLDTAFFQNKRNSNLIEISSDSEDTTDQGESSDSGSESGSDSGSESGSDGGSDSGSDGGSECGSDGGSDSGSIDVSVINCDVNVTTVMNNHAEEEHVATVVSEIVSSPEIKVVTVDLGIITEPEIKEAEAVEAAEAAEELVPISLPLESPIEHAEGEAETPAPVATIPLTSMSVPDLKLLLKEKYKNHPEKHAEIQKLKKAELIFALQQQT
jgi:hypothetical protein